MGVPSDGRDGENYAPSRGRVLHVLGSLDAGGVENWLLEIVRHRSPSDRAFDFCLLGSREGVYAGELRRRGCRIFRCPLRPFFFISSASVHTAAAVELRDCSQPCSSL